MARYRDALPQLGGDLFLTDGGLETSLIFHRGVALPDMAAFPLLRTREGVRLLCSELVPYVALARQHRAGLILDSATWRANPDWAERLGYTRAALAAANRAAIRLLEGVRDRVSGPAVLNGAVGPRGDGYVPSARMTARQAEAYHREQIETFAATAADMVTAYTLNYADEAIGVARAARAAGMPAAISFTVEFDGRLPTGQALAEAITAVDDATGGYPCYYLINCAHPVHFAPALSDEPWTRRVRGLRANASSRTHAELDGSVQLDIGDPDDLGARNADLKRRLPWLNVFGGCCGTDSRHVGAIAAAVAPLFAR
jgi:S-methylmethionine-dependent homocysteine/selenocysteine methylase